MTGRRETGMFRFSEYNKTVIDHYENPRNVGVVDAADAEAMEGNPDGDQMRLTLRIRDEVIREARFQTIGCVAAIASSSIATEMLVGKNLAEADRLTKRDVVRALGGLPEVKIDCSVVAEKAIRAALADFRRRGSRQSG